MITLAWLIRSFQAINRKGGDNIWIDDWFLGILFTLIIILLDEVLIMFISSIIKSIN